MVYMLDWQDTQTHPKYYLLHLSSHQLEVNKVWNPLVANRFSNPGQSVWLKLGDENLKKI